MKTKKVKGDITGIFPTPIYLSSIKRKLTKSELLFVNKAKLKSHDNEGNITSDENYLLEKKPFNNLKKEIFERVEDYFERVLQTTKDIEPFITQSWLNFTTKNQFHHKHKHPNSFLSGVFYVNSNEDFDTIKFFKESYQMITPSYNEWNLYNSESWYFKVKTSDLILFPSYLSHMVEVKEGNNTRISLAFNVFVKGKIGSNSSLTELIL
jgi:uncharacterized protein (TIGR02466 family)|tara:strand:- start:64 stop:690 length:627 start_codon:yes stop_codon:yes gene_type:complete